MKLKPRDLIFIAIVILVVGGLWWLSTRNKAKAMRPTPPEHLTAKFRGECLKCHLPEKPESVLLLDRFLNRDQCLKCHIPEKLAEMELHHKHPSKWRDEKNLCTLCHKLPQETNALKLNTRQINELASFLRRED
jgi:hypothetical protein